MYKKCLIATGTVILCMSTLYADPNWGVTYVDSQYEWAKKAETVEVYMLIEKWADISLAAGEDGRLLMYPLDDDPFAYSGCVDLEVLNNFEGLRIVADLTPDIPATAWSVALSETGHVTPNLDMDHLQATVTIDTINMDFANPAPLTLCVAVKNPVWPVPRDETEPLAKVILTMFIGDTGNHPAGALPPQISVFAINPE